MPFNGAGVYTAPGADFPAVTQTVISSTKYNNVINDIATALSTCLTKDGQQVATGNIPFGGFRATNVGITGIAGSVGTPAINVSDTQTGLYRSAASELAVTVAGTQRGRFDATGLIVTGTVNASTSVVTPLVSTTIITTATDVDLLFRINSTEAWAISSAAGNRDFRPTSTANTQSIGSPTALVKQVFTPIIDSGTTGSLSLKVNNGETVADFIRASGAVANRWTFQGGDSGGGGVAIFPTGGDANISPTYQTRGTGSHNFGTNIGTPVTQFQVLHTASASRNITVTGSNGGNPTIGVTAGSLAITPAVVIAGASLQVGTTPATAGGAILIPWLSAVVARNQANSANVDLVRVNTVNSVNDIVMVGGQSNNSNGVVLVPRVEARAATVSDFPSPFWGMWIDTNADTFKLFCQRSGVLRSVTLA